MSLHCAAVPVSTDGVLYAATVNNFLGTESLISRATGKEGERIRTETSTLWLSGKGLDSFNHFCYGLKTGGLALAMQPCQKQRFCVSIMYLHYVLQQLQYSALRVAFAIHTHRHLCLIRVYQSTFLQKKWFFFPRFWHGYTVYVSGYIFSVHQACYPYCPVWSCCTSFLGFIWNSS